MIKKGEGDMVEEYRGLTLMSTANKVYMNTLVDKLREEIREKEIVSPNQTEFRRGMGMVNNIYVLNYLVN